MESVHPNYIIVPSVGDHTSGQGWDLVPDSYMKLLIKSDTTDGSTTFTDSIGTHTPAVGAATVEHDTAQAKYGASSILFDGDSGYLTIPDHADFNFADGDFTIDWFARFNDLANGKYDGHFSQYDENDNHVFFMTWNLSAVGVLQFSFENADEGIKLDSQQVDLWEEDRWYRFGVERYGNTWTVYVDGVAKWTTTNSTTYPDLAAAFNIGYVEPSEKFMSGWMDQFVVSKGIARFANGLYPPYGPYS